MVDNNLGTDVVATLDVATGLAGNILAQRQIHRNEFAAANQWQTFTLEFDSPCFDLLQGRVWWAGTVNTKFSQLTITAVNAAGVDVEWLVTDQLGTPRMIADQTGSMAGVKRHDYLPFGEELYAGVSGRTAQQGYTGDSVRQKFTGYEADAETQLNFAQARYHSSKLGRFTGADPTMISVDIGAPQSLNRYSYTMNDPLNLVDASGMVAQDPQGPVPVPIVTDEDLKNADFTGAIIKIYTNVWASSGSPLTALEVLMNQPLRSLTEGRLQLNRFRLLQSDDPSLEQRQAYYGTWDGQPDEHVAHDNDDFRRFNLTLSPSIFKGAGVSLSLTWDKYHRHYFSIGPSVGLGLPISASLKTGQTYDANGQHVQKKEGVEKVLTGPTASVEICPVICFNGGVERSQY